jgi:hypothetical protein
LYVNRGDSSRLYKYKKLSCDNLVFSVIKKVVFTDVFEFVFAKTVVGKLIGERKAAKLAVCVTPRWNGDTDRGTWFDL